VIEQALALADAGRKRLGMDRAIAYTFAARACTIIGSTGTVLLIVRFLSRVEQGFYYTLLSLVNLQLVFELGFSFVVLQLAAHEIIHLHIGSDGSIAGDPRAHVRLAAILRKTIRWYLAAGVVMGITLLPAGILFFGRTAHDARALWFWPWTASALLIVVLFVVNPFCSFLEGCGQVRQVAGMRLAQAVLSIVAAWSAMALGIGLYSPAMVIVACIVPAATFLWTQRAIFRGLLRHEADESALLWREEVWSFQWKIAITWLCSYFTVQSLTPVLFAARGPVEAGRLGMSLSIAAYMWNLVFAWMSTKAAPFGQLVAKRDYAALDQLFFHTLWQSVEVLSSLIALCIVAIFALKAFVPSLASRMVSPELFVLLLITAVSTLIVQSEAIYLRAHKEEPLVWQALAVAVLTSGGAYLTAPRWGLVGTCVIYFVCSGVIGVIAATLIFRAKRRSHALQAPKAVGVPAEVVL
jgi:hypothetical protein